MQMEMIMTKEKSPLTLAEAQRHTERVRAAYLDFHNIIDEAFDAGLHVELSCGAHPKNGRSRAWLVASTYVDPTDIVEA